MRSNLLWSDKVSGKEKTCLPIYDVCFSPSGSQLIACSGNNILIYSTSNGELLLKLSTHKDTVFTLDYCLDGKKFSSGGKDKTVIIWSNKGEGLLKYQHSESIQALRWNPVNHCLASCSEEDYGIWSPEVKNVTKYKVNSRILCCSWSFDGQQLALGLYSGLVSIRNLQGEEIKKITRQHTVWSLEWVDYKTLLISDWSPSIILLNADDEQIKLDKKLDFDPCTVALGKDYWLVGGSDKKIYLWTLNGIKIGLVANTDGWIWSCKLKQKHNLVAIGNQTGVISLYQISFNTVHALHKEKYAFRENLTDVVIQHLDQDKKVKFQCNDHVKKIAIYNDRLAIQLSDQIIIYEELKEVKEREFNYEVKEILRKKFDCNLLVCTSQSLILCIEKKLVLLNLDGKIERQWILDAFIRYIKVIGGPEKKETLLIGLKNGQVLLVFINQVSPNPIFGLASPIRCVDLNKTGEKLAVVDDQGNCIIYDLKLKEKVFEENGATSVAWNTEFEDFFCFSGNGFLNVKVGSFPIHQIEMNGFIVGFQGSKIFCLQTNQMITVDIPPSFAFENYLQSKDFEKAYSMACLGVTDLEWQKLGVLACENLNLDIARKSLLRVKDGKYLQLLNDYEQKKNEIAVEEFLGNFFSYHGQLDKAASFYRKAGKLEKAMEMYDNIDKSIKTFQLVEQKTISEPQILPKHSIKGVQNLYTDKDEIEDEIEKEKNKALESALELINVGDYYSAASLYADHKLSEEMINLVEQAPKKESKTLQLCCEYFKNTGMIDEYKKTLLKLGDISKILDFHIQTGNWQEAFKAVDLCPEKQTSVNLAFAIYLSEQGRFSEAIERYQLANEEKFGIQMLKRLLENALIETRFADASHCCFLLSQYIAKSIPDDWELKYKDKENYLKWKEYWKYYISADLFFCYDFVLQFLKNPFTEISPCSTFFIAYYILSFTSKHQSFQIPPSISLSNVLYALVILSSQLLYTEPGQLYSKYLLDFYSIPYSWQTHSEELFLKFKSKEHEDTAGWVCWQCGTVCKPKMPQQNENEQKRWNGEIYWELYEKLGCETCSNPFVFSQFSFESLSLQEILFHFSIKPEDIEKAYQTISNGNDKITEHSNNEHDHQRFQLTSLDSFMKIPKREIIRIPSLYNKKCFPSRYFRIIQISKPEEYETKISEEQSFLDLDKTMISKSGFVCCSECRKWYYREEWEFLKIQKKVHCIFCRRKVKE